MNDKPNYYMKLPMPLRREYDSIKQEPNETFPDYTIRYSEMMCRITEELNRQKAAEQAKKELESAKTMFKIRQLINSWLSSDSMIVVLITFVFLFILTLLVRFLW